VVIKILASFITSLQAACFAAIDYLFMRKK